MTTTSVPDIESSELHVESNESHMSLDETLESSPQEKVEEETQQTDKMLPLMEFSTNSTKMFTNEDMEMNLSLQNSQMDEMSITAPIETLPNTNELIVVQSELINQSGSINMSSAEIESEQKLPTVTQSAEITQSIGLNEQLNTNSLNANKRQQEPEPQKCVESQVIASKIPRTTFCRNPLPTLKIPTNIFSRGMSSQQPRKSLGPKVNMEWLVQSTLEPSGFQNQTTIYTREITSCLQQEIPIISPKKSESPKTSITPKISINTNSKSQTSHTLNPCFKPMSITISRSTSKNAFTTRMELAKSAVKQTIGLGITEKLIQKRDEI
jgi:hypothetical protein